MKRFHIEEEESIITLICESKYYKTAVDELRMQRSFIKNYIGENKDFETTLKPFKYDENASFIIKKMVIASKEFDVGPMATVAGAIAESIVLKLVEKGASEVILDNGGDMAVFLKNPVNIGLYTGNSKIKNIGFNINTTGKLLGICTSSGQFGHSLSFGNSYTTTVFSDSPTFADAAATRIGNDLRFDDSEKISKTLGKSIDYDGISGIFTVTKNHIGSIGDIPEIIKTDNCFSLITRG